MKYYAILMAAALCASALTAHSQSSYGLDTFDESNIYCRNMQLTRNYVLQGFSLDSDGSIWFTNTGPRDQIVLTHAKPDSSATMTSDNLGVMVMKYFGHGTNTAIEEVGDDRYFWVGCYGSANAKGHYWTERLVGRVKFVPGDTIQTDQCDEYYYIGDYTNMHPSIDAENDLLTINYGDDVNGAFRCFVVYKLSEARKAPMRDVSFSCTDAFRSGDKASTKRTDVTVKARDLTALTPVARPKFLKNGYGNKGDRYYAWQGFDVKGDRLYYADGQSSLDLNGRSWEHGSSRAFITVFDFEGNVVEPRTEVAVIGDSAALSEHSLSHFWSMESEGVKIDGDYMYLGFGARGADKDNPGQHSQQILRFKKLK